MASFFWRENAGDGRKKGKEGKGKGEKGKDKEDAEVKQSTAGVKREGNYEPSCLRAPFEGELLGHRANLRGVFKPAQEESAQR